MIRTLTLGAALTLALSGAALAQTAAGGGSAEGNMNNPGSVKSNSQKAMEQPGAQGTGTAPARADTTGSTGNANSTDGVTGNAVSRAPK